MTEELNERTSEDPMKVVAADGDDAAAVRDDVRGASAFDITELSYEMWPDRPPRGELSGTPSSDVDALGGDGR